VEELISMLRETESLEEQGDIIHYLVVSHGLEYGTGMIWNELVIYPFRITGKPKLSLIVR
jgi:hypothetical protein